MAADGSVVIEIKGDADELIKAFRKVSTSADELERDIQGVANNFRTAAAAANRMDGDGLEDASRAADRLDDNLDDAARAADKLDDNLGKATNVVGRLGDIIKGSALGNIVANYASRIADGLVQVGKSAVEAAASVKAQESQFEQTFSGMAHEAEAAVSRVAKTSGIMESRLKGAATSIYGFARSSGGDAAQSLSLMEKALQVAADSAAYYDRSLEDTTETLQSFLKGNYENDAALGLSATETTRNAAAMELFGQKFNDLAEIQKQQVLLQMVQDSMQLSGAMGQASRESGAWENTMGNLNEAWKQFLAAAGDTALENLIPLIQGATSGLEKLSEYVGKVASSGFLKAQKEFADRVSETTAQVDAQAASFKALVEKRDGAVDSIQSEIGIISQYVAELRSITDENGNVIAGYEARAAYLSDYINNKVPGAVLASGNEADANYQVVDSLDALIFARQKEAAMQAYEPAYQEALANRTTAWQNLTNAQRDYSAAQERVAQLEQQTSSIAGYTSLEYGRLRQQLDMARDSMAQSEENLQSAKSTWEGYSNAISDFETIAAVQNLGELNQALSTTSSTIVKSTGDNKAALEKAVVDTQAAYENMVLHVASQWDNLTAEEQSAWATQLSNLRSALDAQVNEAREGGVQIPTAAGEGVNAGAYQFTGAMQSAYEQAIGELAPGADVQQIGASVSKLVGAGVISEVSTVKTSAKETISGAKDSAQSQMQASDFPSVGKNISSGIARGITSNSGSVYSAVRSVVKRALTAAESEADINSPSRVFRDRVGIMIARGIAVGITDGIKYVVRASKNVVDVTAEQITKLNDKIEAIEAAAQKRQADKELAEYQKNLKEKYDELEKAELKERAKIQEEIDKLEADWAERQLQAQEKAQKEALQSRINALEDIQDAYQDAMDEVVKARDSMSGKLSDFELFDNDDGDLYLWDIQKMIDQIQAYGDAMTALKDRGIADSLFQKIVEMDREEAILYAKKLLALGDAQYDAYMNLWEQKEAASEQVAKSLYQSEVDAIEEEYAGKLPDSLGKVADDAMGTFADRMATAGEAAVNTAKNIADRVLAELERVNAAQRLTAAVGMSTSSFSASLGSKAQNDAEARTVARRASATETAMATAFMQTGKATRDVVLQVNGKEFARATLDDYRSVEDQSPRIVSD